MSPQQAREEANEVLAAKKRMLEAKAAEEAAEPGSIRRSNLARDAIDAEETFRTMAIEFVESGAVQSLVDHSIW